MQKLLHHVQYRCKWMVNHVVYYHHWSIWNYVIRQILLPIQKHLNINDKCKYIMWSIDDWILVMNFFFLVTWIFFFFCWITNRHKVHSPVFFWWWWWWTLEFFSFFIYIAVIISPVRSNNIHLSFWSIINDLVCVCFVFINCHNFFPSFACLSVYS